jgi:glycosyltransferase involved in cell wall biosynthesis
VTSDAVPGIHFDVSNSLPLSVAIITLNEETNLPRCLASVRGLASEIVVIDSGSTDQTAKIAEQFGAVFEFQPWQGHVAQKNIALRRCTQSWVLCLDADEVLSTELARSISDLLRNGDPKQDGFWLNRRTFYLGEWIWHAWYPEWRLRLVRKGHAEWRGDDPHDKLEVNGPTARLEGDLLHYSYRDMQDHLQRIAQYSRIAANSYWRKGRRCRWYHLTITPGWAFWKQLVLKQAWRDGWRGWIISFYAMVYVFSKYVFLLEKELTDTPPRK